MIELFFGFKLLWECVSFELEVGWIASSASDRVLDESLVEHVESAACLKRRSILLQPLESTGRRSAI